MDIKAPSAASTFLVGDDGEMLRDAGFSPKFPSSKTWVKWTSLEPKEFQTGILNALKKVMVVVGEILLSIESQLVLVKK